MKKRTAVKRKVSKGLNREVGVLGYIALIVIGVSICSFVTIWAYTATCTISISSIPYI